jgi:hypothetical protein
MSRDLESGDSGNSVDQPASDASERAEAEWLLARETNPAAPAPSPQAAAEYVELEHMLATLPDPRSDHSWHDEVLKKALASPDEVKGEMLRPTPAARRAWWKRSATRWGGGAAAAAAAAAAAIVVVGLRAEKRTSREESEVAVAPSYEGGVRGDSERLSGISASGPKGELRVFRKASLTATGYLVARCVPSEVRCKEKGNELVLSISLEEPGYYYVVSADRAVTGADDATLEEFQQAARRQGLKVRTSPDYRRR